MDGKRAVVLGVTDLPGFEFDMEKFLKHSKRLAVEDLPWDRVREHPMSEGEVRFMRYMMNIEHHTVLYMRDLLSTSAVLEPDVVAFLTIWNYEEFWHGHFQEKLVREYVGPHEELMFHESRAKRAAQSFKARVRDLLSPVLTGASPDFAATHMTWGAMQEFTTLFAYEAVIRQSNHPMLQEILRRVVRDERRHFAFYYQQAERRLARSKFMQKETKFIMDRLWRPVGAGSVMSNEDMDFVAWYLFRGEQGLADVRRVDETIARLPGMDGWNGLERHIMPAIKRFEETGEASSEKWAKRREPWYAPIPKAA